ncbi:hypothetical protein [Frankia sp. Cas4]|uniref:hypothetical protein n=1 Tax=Frankia sp. Cas4 TaxID=3073927 RepID=UPI002AD36379|nr:hypothetical protein [Frankia sp. Cas4]
MNVALWIFQALLAATFLTVGGLALVVGGSVVHLRRSETPAAAAFNVVFLVLLGAIAWGRFGPYRF